MSYWIHVVNPLPDLGNNATWMKKLSASDRYFIWLLSLEK
ncbi:hypothetical protein SCH4B_0115 [Ruegeria sp. TrichCH4B]|nr:hypothetical protein SCH4B_0115 [Ruegeria sp. TrichCH4B]